MIKKELVRLGRHMLIYGGGDVVVRFMSFFLLPLFTRYLTPADYGIRGLLLAISSMLVPVFSLGLSAAVGPIYFENNSMQRKADTIWSAFGLLILSSIVMLAGGWILAPQICQLVFQSSDYTGLFVLTLWTTVLTILSEPFNFYLRFEEKARSVVLVAVFSAAITISVSIICVVLLRQGVLGLVMAGLIGHASVLVFMMMPALFSLPIHWEKELVMKMLKLGIPLIPSFACLYVIQQAGKYMLQWKQGLDEVGIYQMGMSIGLFVSVMVGAFQSAWYPFFMSFIDRQQDARRVFSRVLTYYILGAGTLIVLFFAVARPVIMIMTQPQFWNAFRVIGLAAAGLCFQGLYLALLPPMYFRQEVQWQTPIQLAAAVLSLALNLVLIHWAGSLGVAFAFMAGHFLMVLFTLAWNKYRGDSYLRIPMEWKRIVPFILLAVILGGLFVLPREWSLTQECLAAGMALLLTLTVLFLLTTIQERAFVKRLVMKWLAVKSKKADLCVE